MTADLRDFSSNLLQDGRILVNIYMIQVLVVTPHPPMSPNALPALFGSPCPPCGLWFWP